MRLVLYSMDDIAGANIARILQERFGFLPTGEEYLGQQIYQKGDTLLFGTKSSVRNLQEIPYKPDVCIVASRHRSESGKPTLTCHPTGNFGQAALGGAEGALQIAPACHLRQVMLGLRSNQNMYGLVHEVSLEVTHHGPTNLPFPLMYAEVGSAEAQWRDENACQAVAKAIHDVLFCPLEDVPSAIGFGGPHYAPNFNLVIDNYAIGHIMPKHAIDNLSRQMVLQMLEKTVPKPNVAVIDWKGLKGADRDRLIKILDELGIKWVRTSDLK
jgi:D-aminoacyl-tRNA deacylase